MKITASDIFAFILLIALVFAGIRIVDLTNENRELKSFIYAEPPEPPVCF